MQYVLNLKWKKMWKLSINNLLVNSKFIKCFIKYCVKSSLAATERMSILILTRDDKTFYIHMPNVFKKDFMQPWCDVTKNKKVVDQNHLNFSLLGQRNMWYKILHCKKNILTIIF